MLALFDERAQAEAFAARPFPVPAPTTRVANWPARCVWV
jgi:hypothetical protein